MRPRSIYACACTLAMSVSVGCYAPDGGFSPSSNSTFTYVSETWSPKTVQVIDTRSNEAIFSLRLPVGKQLTMKFLEGEGDDPVSTPDRMQWEVWDAPQSTGKLSNQLTVPPAGARRIQMTIRDVPEYPPDSEMYRLRVDDPEDRPPHWTPEGGPIPQDGPINRRRD